MTTNDSRVDPVDPVDSVDSVDMRFNLLICDDFYQDQDQQSTQQQYPTREWLDVFHKTLMTSHFNSRNICHLDEFDEDSGAEHS